MGSDYHVLVTGGTGYIGSHTVLSLLEEGYYVTIADNLSNSDRRVLERLSELAGDRYSLLSFQEVDLCDPVSTTKLFESPQGGRKIDAVIHFAGLKAVGESVSQPLRYYENNIGGTVNLLQAMDKAGCQTLVFSSSATVYGDPEKVPATEENRLSATNPYGRTKLFIEEICRDMFVAKKEWKISLLRYFNPVGAHPSGRIGEAPNGVPNNLMPYVMQVAVGRRDELTIFGTDYPTPDGTGVRDYIHVMDLAEGHVAALKYLRNLQVGECRAVNLGTGQGTSVLEIVAAFEEASGKEIKRRFAERRPGDIATVYAKTDMAESLFNWKASRSVKDMCADLWKWASNNPYGYATKEELESA